MWETLFSKILEIGPLPALLVLGFMVGWLIRLLDKNAKADSERAESFQKALAALVKDIDDRFKQLDDRSACIEREYLTREAHYKDVGGWRTDMNQLRSDMFEEIRGVRTEMSNLNSGILTTALTALSAQKGASDGNTR
jgi:hypothetical protein